MYYRIDWCISKNALGGTRSHKEARLENVILWLRENVKALEKRAAGFSVYECRDDERADALPVTVYNWQEKIYDPESYQNFGHLHVDNFPVSIIMSQNHTVVCVAKGAPEQKPLPFTLDEFAACYAPAQAT
ncbi:MAG: hypothetical protein IJ124_14635 [Clostridia bacterium]|nr:hypothetical protein [Clostridia bacterium]